MYSFVLAHLRRGVQMKAKLLLIASCLFFISYIPDGLACHVPCGGGYHYVGPGPCPGEECRGACSSCSSYSGGCASPLKYGCSYATLDGYVQMGLGYYNCDCLDPACDYYNRCLSRSDCCHAFGNIGAMHFEDDFDP